MVFQLGNCAKQCTSTAPGTPGGLGRNRRSAGAGGGQSAAAHDGHCWRPANAGGRALQRHHEGESCAGRGSPEGRGAHRCNPRDCDVIDEGQCRGGQGDHPAAHRPLRGGCVRQASEPHAGGNGHGEDPRGGRGCRVPLPAVGSRRREVTGEGAARLRLGCPARVPGARGGRAQARARGARIGPGRLRGAGRGGGLPRAAAGGGWHSARSGAWGSGRRLGSWGCRRPRQGSQRRRGPERRERRPPPPVHAPVHLLRGGGMRQGEQLHLLPSCAWLQAPAPRQVQP
mmetsp:Transcript_97462/g.271113  ORF Transcript_97462/g.271113 Transcript_97462/m.271113 type:complete len:285 (-) Transcript_97462:390-1244(-)